MRTALSLQWFQIVDSTVDHMDAEPYYEYEVVSETNMYLFKKDVKKSQVSSEDGVCKCPDNGVI